MKLFICIYLFCITIIIALPINKTAINTIHPVVPNIGKKFINFFIMLLKNINDSSVLCKLQNLLVRTSNQDLLRLYQSSQDPEVRPGLFEGDIAVTSEVHIILSSSFCYTSSNMFHFRSILIIGALVYAGTSSQISCGRTEQFLT